MTLKITYGHRKCRHYFLLVVCALLLCSNSVFILHRFRDITSFIVYVTLRSASFSIRPLQLLTMYVFQFVREHILANTRYIFQGIRLAFTQLNSPPRSLKVVQIGAIR